MSTSSLVPRRHESVLFVPPRRDLYAVVGANARLLNSADVEISGRSLRDLRVDARSAVLTEAIAYTESIISEDIAVERDLPLVVTGHQPELFHTGVWAKNFQAAGLARDVHGLALNLIIDNDTFNGSNIQIPTGTHDAPVVELIAFDAPQPAQPWEERRISDKEEFKQFGQRVRSRIRECWRYEPLVTQAWNAAIQRADQNPRLCDCLTAARVAIERKSGLRNLEVPMSRVCQTSPFYEFAIHILANLPRFHAVYNESIRGYRKKHHLRSVTHPVPELDQVDGWREAPFWVWRAGDHRRDRPFVRQAGQELQIRDSHGVFARLPISNDGPLDEAVRVFGEIGNQGIRFRTRALTTTLFARLFLADLFIHGIGGAKYDAMTDEICERFLGLKAPQFATVSATVYLPLGASFPVSNEDVRRIEHSIRDTHYNPDRCLEGGTDQAALKLIEEKKQTISRLTSRHPSRAEHQRLTQINTLLFEKLTDRDQALRSTRDEMRRQVRANSVLQNREFSWCLQPETTVASFLQREFLG